MFEQMLVTKLNDRRQWISMLFGQVIVIVVN